MGFLVRSSRKSFTVGFLVFKANVLLWIYLRMDSNIWFSIANIVFWVLGAVSEMAKNSVHAVANLLFHFERVFRIVACG